jgi:uncharacterized protein
VTAFALVAVVLVIATIVLDRAAVSVLYMVPRAPDRTVPDTGVYHEDLVIRSGDHDLGAWLLKPPGEPERPLVLLAHGWGANYSLLLQLAEPLVADGYEVLLFDIRGHGRNEAVPFVTVRHFRDDIVSVVEYANGRFPSRPLVLVGHSLGGAASVLAVAEGARVDGLVLVAAPSDVRRVTAEYLSERGLPGGLMAALFTPFWWRRAGSRFGPLTPTRRIPEVQVPLRIVQPEHDERIARSHADALAGASGQDFDLILGAKHNDVLGRDETRAIVTELLAP